MIIHFHGHERARYARVADEMFALRARQFRDRLGWAVEVKDGLEIDRFDDLDPLYLVSLDPQTGAVVGCLRFLPTTGPTMMKEVFDAYFPEPFSFEAPLVWECTRFAIDPAASARYRTPTGLCRITFELMQGGCELAMQAGVTHIVGVFDRAMQRIYERAGWTPDVVGTSTRLESGRIHVGVWDVDAASLTSMRLRSGLDDSVVEPASGRILV